MSILQIKNLKTSFYTHVGEVKAVRGVSIEVDKGETIGIVGESGCGKSVTMMSVMGLLTENGKVVDGEVLLNGENILTLKEKQMVSLRGNEMAMIFQDPMTSLNPVFKVGNQMTDHLKYHKKIKQAEADRIAIEMLKLVGIPEPEQRMKQYPHEFSGGMRQRVMIAMALVTQPAVLIADEPTTALDVTIQAQIIEILKGLNEKLKTAIILITHDLGVVADITKRVYVMYGGLIVEQGETTDIYANPAHPYTRGLLNSVPNPLEEAPEKLTPIEGQPPDLIAPPKGCPFCARCGYAKRICDEQMPEYYDLGNGHKCACFLYHEHFKGELPWKNI